MTGVRIASLLASGTEIVCGLGLRERLVAISHECDFPAEVTHLPRVTHTNIDADASSEQIDQQVRSLAEAGQPLYGIDVDTLASLNPDVIVTQAHCDVCAVSYDAVVAAIADTPSLVSARVVALNPNTLDGIFDDIKAVAKAVNAPELATPYMDQLRGRIDFVRSKTKSLETNDRPRVACIEWVEPLMLASNWMPELIEIAGGQSGMTIAGQPSSHTNWTDVVAFDPQVMIVMPCGFDLPRAITETALLQSLPGWQELSAVQSGRVYAADGNAYFNRSGPRIVDSLELLAMIVHPNIFANEFGARLGDAFRQTESGVHR